MVDLIWTQYKKGGVGIAKLRCKLSPWSESLDVEFCIPSREINHLRRQVFRVQKSVSADNFR